MYRKYFGKGEKLLLISPLIKNILLPDVRFLRLKKDQIFSSRKALIRDNRSRDNESRLLYEYEINVVFVTRFFFFFFFFRFP